jgi:small subunit ribosomal protein S17e
MNRVKRISAEILQRYTDKFSDNFESNKEAIKTIAFIRSKVLRNKVAGYITSYQRKENASRPGTTNSAQDKYHDEISVQE